MVNTKAKGARAELELRKVFEANGYAVHQAWLITGDDAQVPIAGMIRAIGPLPAGTTEEAMDGQGGQTTPPAQDITTSWQSASGSRYLRGPQREWLQDQDGAEWVVHTVQGPNEKPEDFRKRHLDAVREMKQAAPPKAKTP